ncbi:Uncharacterized protein C12orf50, partial [Podiceps cristatus]
FPLQQKYSNISCYWETQASGCLRIRCAFHHSKPRLFNGLFLPPSNNAPLQQGVQAGSLHPAHHQKSLTNQVNIVRPIHPPPIINLNDKEDNEEEENCKQCFPFFYGKVEWRDIEEERAIKEICYKSGK